MKIGDGLAMDWRWIGDDWRWISNSGCINDPISTTRLEIGSLLKKIWSKTGLSLGVGVIEEYTLS